MATGATSKYLSEFQVVKFKYMFNAFFDITEVKLNLVVELSCKNQNCNFYGYFSEYISHISIYFRMV